VRTIVGAVLIAWGLAGCTDRQAIKEPGNQGKAALLTPVGEMSAVGEQGLYRFRIQTEPAPIKLGGLFSVWTIVENARDGSKIESGKLELDATMPDHQHGMTTLPKTRQHEGGRFRTVGCRFHMHGRWVVDLKFEEAGQSDHATIEFPFHPPAVK
jgi:YtkA-like